MIELQWDEGKKRIFYYMSQKGNEELVALKMIEHNRIPGLLPMHQQYIDEQICFSYEVQGYSTLQRILEQRPVSVKWVCRILWQIIQILLAGEAYFLSVDEYYIISDYIYYDQKKHQIALCYLPGSGLDVYQNFRTLLETMMEYLDHGDKKAVTFYYSLYDMYSKGEVSLAELQEHLYLYEQEKSKEDERLKPDQAEDWIRQAKKETSQHDLVTAENSNYYLSLYHQQFFFSKAGQNLTELLPLQFAFSMGRYQVGRQKGQDLVLLPQQISRNHALLEADQSQVYITDRGSVNGTFVNGRKISAHVKTRLEMEDVITFADISYQIFSIQEEASELLPKGKNKCGNILHVLDSFRQGSLFSGGGS